MTKARIIISILAAVLLASCAGKVKPQGGLALQPDIYPDYKGVEIPCNIAPLNFEMRPAAGGPHALVIEPAGAESAPSLTIRAKGGAFDIPAKKWRRMLQACAGSGLRFTVCRKDSGRWIAYEPFEIRVSPDSIDKYLAYRLLPPLYGTWINISLCQRDLESFSERAFYANDVNHGNCANCHSFCNRDPQRMLFHMRGNAAGTYISVDGRRERLDTKTDSTVSSFVYPYWHPSGRFVAFSVNNTRQVFHTANPNRIEVYDDASDIIVYDIDRGEAFTSPLLRRNDRYETFPAFSPDGRTLYFCSSIAPEKMPEDYKDVKYSLLAISFDPETRAFGAKADTLYDAAAGGLSMTLPRPSPDGRRLVATLAEYGNFHIWHHDADLWMLDLATGKWSPMDAANSPDVESYHSWSGNSRWLAFSSRRDDGLYTRPYFAHVAEDGSVSKPFMLPQRHPGRYYADQENSYNIPEFVSGKIDLSPRQAAKWSACPARPVGWQSADF